MQHALKPVNIVLVALITFAATTLAQAAAPIATTQAATSIPSGYRIQEVAKDLTFPTSVTSAFQQTCHFGSELFGLSCNNSSSRCD